MREHELPLAYHLNMISPRQHVITPCVSRDTDNPAMMRLSGKKKRGKRKRYPPSAKIMQQEPEAYYPEGNPNLAADEEDDMEQTEEEPICVLKVELDGEHTE